MARPAAYTDKTARSYIDGQVKVFQPKDQPLLSCRDFLSCDTSVFDPAVKTDLVATKEALVPFDFEFALNDFLNIPSTTTTFGITGLFACSTYQTSDFNGTFSK